jgi:signal transduction histidine kinase
LQSIKEIVNNTLISNFRHPIVAIDAEMNVVFSKGLLSSYLADDEALEKQSFLKSLNPDLQEYTRALLNIAKQSKNTVKGAIIKYPIEEVEKYLQLIVHISNPKKDAVYYILEFHAFDLENSRDLKNDSFEEFDSKESSESRKSEYESELSKSKLDDFNQELEALNEELQASNEELNTSNEELQLANEELLAVNKELRSANDQLVKKEKEILDSQAEIKTLNERFETVLENSNVFVAYQDLNLNYVWLHNPSNDYDAENLIGVSDLDLFKFEDKGASNSFVDLKLKVIETKKEIKEEVFFNEQYWSIHIKPWFNGKELKGVIVLSIDITEQREAYKKLELREQIISALASSSKDYLLIVDQNYIIQTISEPLCEDIADSTGVELKAGDSLISAFPKLGELNDQIFYPLQKALNGEQTLIDKFDELKDSLPKFQKLYSTRISPIRGKQNNIIGAEFRGTEITDIMRSKLAVQDALKRGAHLTGEEYFKDLTLHLYELFNSKSAYVGVLSSDKNKIITKAIRIDGVLSDNFIYQLDEVPCQVVQQKDAMQHYEEVLSTFPQDPKLKRWDATSYVGVPISSPITGEMLGIMVIINDEEVVIDADAQYLLTILSLRAGAELLRQRATHELEIKEKQFENITKNSPGVIYEFEQGQDGKEKFKYVSSSSYDVLEIKPKELLQNTELIYDVIHPEDRKGFFEKQMEDSKNPRPLQWIGRMVTAQSQTVKWVKLSSQPDVQANGDVIWYGIIDDITRQKEIENELKRAKEEAEEAANAKEDFLATMSHEIRTPLNAIYGISELLRLDKTVGEMEEVDLLKYSAENLLSLVNNILDFSKLKAGKLEIKQKPFELKKLFDSICKSTHFLANKNNNDCVLEVDENLPQVVVGDELILSQILHNLLGNANKFTKDGKITLKVVLLDESKESLDMSISVIDTGEGIAKEDLSKIFSKFEQSEHNIASKGTGLGLTITKSLLQLLGSNIEVESEKGKGSTFHFQLSLRKSKEHKSINRSTSNVSIPEERPLIKVLMIEDNDDNRLLVSKYFSAHKHIQLDLAENGKEGVEKVSNFNYDVILMDMRMPIMSGSEAIKEIRQLEGPSYNKLPIIALTADTYGVSKEIGFNDIMTKPYKFDDLKKMIEKYGMNKN